MSSWTFSSVDWGNAMRLPHLWGVTEKEIAAAYPCDDLLTDVRVRCLRGVTVKAERPVTFRWLCQLKVAPYSYDVINNWGKRSPRTLTPGVEKLEKDQRLINIFRIVDFEVDRHITVLLDESRRKAYGRDIAVSYTVADGPEPGTSRLLVALVVNGKDGVWDKTQRELLAWGDLVMMYGQLTNLRKLAERHQSENRN